MYEYVRNNWNTGNDISCPQCSVLLSHNAIQLILFNHGDTILYERYTKFDLDRSLENNPEFIWCAHGCGSGQLNEGATMNNTVECINCHKLTCFTHRSPWHEGLTCKEYDMPRTDGQEHASKRWIGVNTKECSKCRAHIEKNAGCDHMTCSKCKYEFCWECLAPYSNIKRHGAYLHNRTCKHYPATETRTIFKRFIDLF
jgi:E3 ubiquitin-protein ligase RNF14